MDLEMAESIKERLSLAHLGKPALIGVVALLVMVAVVAGRLLISTATANDFEIVKDSETTSQEAEASEADSAPQTMYIHVSGAVGNPGLVEVPVGARVADAVQAAGGFAEDAKTDSVNLARTLTDGEQIVIAQEAPEGAVAAEAPVASEPAAAAPAASASGLVNINTASAEELVSLPGIGEATAKKIIDDRQANGSFKTIEDLKRVSGIGDKKFESLSGLICV